MAAIIRSTQSATTIDGASRDDLATGIAVTLDSVDTHTTYSWTMAYRPPGSAAAFSGSATAKTPGTFTPDVEGPYLIRLIVDLGLGTESTQFVRLRVITATAGLKLVAAGETYTGSPRIPVDASLVGWADDQNENLLSLESLVGGGGGPTIQKVTVRGPTIRDFENREYHAVFGSGLLNRDPGGTDAMNIPSGTLHMLLLPGYPIIEEPLLFSNSSSRYSTTSVWDYTSSVVSIPVTNTSMFEPYGGLASTAPVPRDGKMPVIPPTAGDRSTGFYFEIEYHTAVPDCLRVGLYDVELLRGGEMYAENIIGGVSPNGDYSLSVGTPTVAFQSDGAVFVGTTTATYQFSGAPSIGVGDRIGVLLEYYDFATRSFTSLFNPAASNDFLIRAYFYHKPFGLGGTWLNGADPTTGEGAVYFSGGFASGSIVFSNGAGTTDNDIFTIDDGLGSVRVYEWDSDASGVTVGDVAITYTGAETAEQMRDLAVAAVLADRSGGNIDVYAGAGGSVDEMTVVAGRVGTTPNGAGPDSGGTSGSMTATAFADGYGCSITALALGVSLANDIRAKVAIDLENPSPGDYVRVRNTSTGTYEYLGYDAVYTSEIVIDSGNAGAGDSVTLGLGTGPATSLTMTATAGAPGVDEFQIGASAVDTATNLVGAINSSANWNVWVVAELDPINDRMVVVRPTVALGANLDSAVEAHTILTTSGGATLFDSVTRVNYISSLSGGNLATASVATLNRLGGNTTKGERMVFVYQSTTSPGSDAVTMYAYPDGSAGNNLIVEAFVGDGSGSTLGTGGGALTGGQDFPEVEFFFTPGDWVVGGALPNWAGPWGASTFQSNALPVDTSLLALSGVSITPLSLEWDNPIPFNLTGWGRSMDIVFSNCTTTGDVVIEYFRSDIPYTDITAPEVVTVAGPLAAYTGTVPVDYPILRLQSINANITGGSFSVQVGDLFAPVEAPVGLVSGVVTPGTLLTSPPPAITIMNHNQEQYTFQPAVGGADGNMMDLYTKHPGSVAEAVIPSGSPQRYVYLLTAYYEVENT